MNVHGGGYVYGTKEVYYHYCMSLAQHGFTVVNFNYTLAPKKKFPNQLCEINMVMEWIKEHKDSYPFDINNVFHCNMNLKEAHICNADECRFFKQFIN